MAPILLARAAACLALVSLVALPAAQAQTQIPATPRDFKVAGTQTGDVPHGTVLSSMSCRGCHGSFWDADDKPMEPWANWAGSLMALGGKDPLFFAQLATANQDVANVGGYCLRCHLPNAVVSGTVAQADGSTLNDLDREGVNCHFCHAMVDPIYKEGNSPAEDLPILEVLEQLPGAYGNAMFVLDPQGLRRGPRSDAGPSHELIVSPFHRASAFCGTCHDASNVAVSRHDDGSWHYNTLDQPAPDQDPTAQFPLERTYSEWKHSAFAQGGVDLGGRFGGSRGAVVSSCQDCHMPGVAGKAATTAPRRPAVASHAFAGAAVPSLDLIAAHTAGDPAVDQADIAAGRERALDMLKRAADVELRLDAGELVARVINQTGHKLPTGHIEGRRVWLNLRYYNRAGTLIGELGAWDGANAVLDASGITVYEMHVGLSPDAATRTGRPAGVTSHMALADTIVKDTRIPPRGYTRAAFEAAGAPAVGIDYADGMYWHESRYAIPAGTARILATLNYQTLPREYVEALRDGNTTDHWGNTLHALWEATGKGAPIAITQSELDRVGVIFADGFDG